jgi:hypothetical protein
MELTVIICHVQTWTETLKYHSKIKSTIEVVFKIVYFREFEEYTRKLALHVIALMALLPHSLEKGAIASFTILFAKLIFMLI